jgi:hypothetical protein
MTDKKVTKSANLNLKPAKVVVHVGKVMGDMKVKAKVKAK